MILSFRILSLLCGFVLLGEPGLVSVTLTRNGETGIRRHTFRNLGSPAHESAMGSRPGANQFPVCA